MLIHRAFPMLKIKGLCLIRGSVYLTVAVGSFFLVVLANFQLLTDEFIRNRHQRHHNFTILMRDLKPVSSNVELNHYSHEEFAHFLRVRHTWTSEVLMSLRSPAERLIEDQTEVLSLLSPELLKINDRSRNMALLGNGYDSSQLHEVALPEAPPPLANRLFPDTYSRQDLSYDDNGGAKNVLNHSSSNSQLKIDEAYRGIAFRHGLQYGGSSKERLFLVEFVRGERCQREAQLATITATKKKPEITILRSKRSMYNTEENLLNKDSSGTIDSVVKPEDVLIVVVNSDRIASSNRRRLKRSMQRLRTYVAIHNYTILQDFAYQLLSAEEHVSLLYNVLTNTSFKLIVSLSPFVYVNDMQVSVEKLLQLSSHWRSRKKLNDMGVDTVISDKETEPMKSPVRLPVDIVSVMDTPKQPRNFVFPELLILRNSERVRNFLLNVYKILSNELLPRDAQEPNELKREGGERLSNVEDLRRFRDALTLAYYRATETCKYTLLLPQKGIISSGASNAKEFLTLRN